MGSVVVVVVAHEKDSDSPIYRMGVRMCVYASRPVGRMMIIHGGAGGV